MSAVCPNGHLLSDGLCVAYKCERLSGGDFTPPPVVFPTGTVFTTTVTVSAVKPPTAQERFSRELRRTRKMIGLKQIHIATEMEITQSTYSKWERSRLLPNPIQMGVLIGVFDNRAVALATSYALDNGVTIDQQVELLYQKNRVTGMNEDHEAQIIDLENAYKAALAGTLTR